MRAYFKIHENKEKLLGNMVSVLHTVECNSEDFMKTNEGEEASNIVSKPNNSNDQLYESNALEYLNNAVTFNSFHALPLPSSPAFHPDCPSLTLSPYCLS